MAMTYRFSKEDRDEVSDYDTSYAFRLYRGQGWLHLNRKATQLIEKDDHYEVILEDWYINIGDKHIPETLERQRKCNELQEYYLEIKKIRNDKETKN